MKIKTADLIGPALDWAVAKCEGEDEEVFRLFYNPSEPTDYDEHGNPEFHYSIDWSQGGPIIEREGIATKQVNDGTWRADYSNAILKVDGSAYVYLHTRGPTPLIAAMRCLVRRRLGDGVEVPDELM